MRDPTPAPTPASAPSEAQAAASASDPQPPAPFALGELARLADAPVRPVTGVRILRDGEDAFPAMIELIDGARREVHFENFIFAGDATGRRFAAALTAAAQRGRDVRVLYDPVGTLMVRGGSIARTLRNSGVTVRAFRPLSPTAPWSWLRLRHRDHRKSLTVDGEVAVVGGLCISDNWSPSTSGGHGWRDTALLVRGPVVHDVRHAFQTMWRHATEAPVAPPAVAAAGVGAPAALVAADHPGAKRVASLYEWLAGRAQRTLEITDAYLVAPRSLLGAFEAAARRGVEVTLLLPGRNNHPLAGAAARRIYARLMAAGVRIFEWEGVMVHAKTAVVDGEVTLVGSSNLDPLSMHRNYELNLLVVDPVTGAGMRAMFARDLGGARRVEPEAWGRRPLWQRCAESTAAVFAPNL